MDQKRIDSLLRQYGEVGICTRCGDGMIWQKEDVIVPFQQHLLTIRKMNLLVCTNNACTNKGKDEAEYERLVQRAKRRFYLTKVTESDASFLENYTD